jgi:iron complex outermembrane receptor protein
MPSEIEETVRMNVGSFPDGTPSGGRIVLTGNPDLHPERVESFEIGYRLQATASATFDATAFHNSMRDLIRSAPGAPELDPSGQSVIPTTVFNAGKGRTEGVEFLCTDSPASNWNVSLGYTLFKGVSNIPSSPTSTAIDVTVPRHQLQLRSALTVARQLDWDWSAYYVGPLGESVPAYLRLDTQFSWHAAARWTLSISGQNLLQSRHAEFAGTNGELDLAAPIQRSINGSVVWRF